MNAFTHYLQIEGVNIEASVLDTSQLGTVRGGSLLLKLAVELLGNNSAAQNAIAKFNVEKDSRVPTFVRPGPGLPATAPITTGASSGIFELAGGDPATAIAQIGDYLSRHDYFRHLTFTLVAEPAGSDFVLAKERLIARTRQAQLRQPSVAPPAPVDRAQAVPCRLQGLLPADAAMALPPKDLKERTPEPKVAASCQNRFYFGRHAKFALYAMEIEGLKEDADATAASTTELDVILNRLKQYMPAESLDEIGDRPAYPKLENKMAVIYFDGNEFGKIQRTLMREARAPADGDDPARAAQKDFDRRIKHYRRGFLAELVRHWLDRPDTHLHTVIRERRDGRGGMTQVETTVLPLETLLWGGDEMLFVVPASKGLELVQFFYHHSQGWTSRDKDGEPLTHAGGIVFCHYKTPIGRATRLARDLADAVKEKPYGRKENYFDTVVLESIDYPAEKLKEFFRKRYGAVARHRFPLQPALPPTGEETSATETPWETLAQALQNLLVRGERTCPKSQAYGIARAALKADWPPAASKAEPGEQAQLRPSSRKRDDGSIEKFASAFHQELWRFKQLQNPGSADAGDTPPATDTTLPAAGSPDAPAQTSAGVLPDLKKLLWDDLLRPPAPLANIEAEPAAPGADPPDPVPLARWQWLHLVELWDYLAPVRDEKTATGQGTGTPAATDPATGMPA